ncbi:MAG: 16S rRNA (cytosine(1402)-N(4))-methyltransferase RsmH [Patescibacteria group bacterium]
MPTVHTAVLALESVSALLPHSGGLYLDGTLGGGTHAQALLQASAPNGRVLSLDVDRMAIERARNRLGAYGSRWEAIEGNFKRLDEIAKEKDFAPLNGILLDLGFSSDEIADPQKGLSFLVDGPLDMRLGPQANDDGMTAADIVNTWSQSDLIAMLRNFGEESHALRIAQAITEARKAARIIGTLDLVSIIQRAVPRIPGQHIHPATKTFQALRIAVNDELENLRLAISASQRVLKPKGRLAIISFHSLEDRIVKKAFAESGWNPVSKKPTTPSEEEVTANPRARSAKLRVAERVS